MPDKIKSEERHGGQVVRMTLNNPKGNVLDAAMMGELQSALDSFKSKPEIKLIEFIGEGKHFSFGASVEEHKKENAASMLSSFHKLFYTLIELAIPSVALVSGQCLGGGLELALVCNFMFVDKSAMLGQPEINLGVFAPPASVILPMKIGQSRADDLLLTGRTISGEEAAAIGLATALCESRESMLSDLDQWITQLILPKSASSLRYGVKAARIQFNHLLTNRLKELEHLYINKLMITPDANEGIASFLKRRKPKWENG